MNSPDINKSVREQGTLKNFTSHKIKVSFAFFNYNLNFSKLFASKMTSYGLNYGTSPRHANILLV